MTEDGLIYYRAVLENGSRGRIYGTGLASSNPRSFQAFKKKLEEKVLGTPYAALTHWAPRN